ncbi:Extracellular ribonuclease [Thalictrum thalictroides]|uniref:Extracellular ribonuclease n=1 Tax=Thalictrum thalictroides TaxID=46969 RepID=A0A7J6VMA9_THATH|nr:Extracellular ribonuclease [Thalictrum thalictroides]
MVIFTLISEIFRWLKFFKFSRRLASGIVAFYLLGLTVIGEAHGDPYLSLEFACEDVSHYYASIDHKEGKDLMKELNSIISSHKSLSYKEVWKALKLLDAADDENPEASSDVIEIYSLRVVPKLLAGKPEGWNREHLWPRSYGLNDGPSLTDLHNIRPADVNVNSSRGNKYYGECLATSTNCLKPANKEAAYDTEADKKIWAPPVQVRGDIARAIMYMATCYGFNQSDGSPNLRLSDSPSAENKEMGLLSTLLKWNELDPPSRTEQLRNNRVCRLYQHNRNPFVDHPEYANLIWKQAVPSRQKIYTPLKAWINELYYHKKVKDKNEGINWKLGSKKR